MHGPANEWPDTSEWAQVRDEPLAADMEAAVQSCFSFGVIQSMVFLTGRRCINTHEMSLDSVGTMFQDTTTDGRPRGAAGVHNPYLRVPKTKDALDKIIGVKPIERYTVHVCWKDTCTHWWVYSKAHEVGECLPLCPACICPKCHTSRYKSVNGEIKARECFVMWDVFEQFFLDAHLCKAILQARKSRSAAFHCTPQCKRLRKDCVKKYQNFDPDQVQVSVVVLASSCLDPCALIHT